MDVEVSLGDDLTTWREQIEIEMRRHGETWADVAGCTLDDAELDRRFDHGLGSVNGAPFTLWTTARVYFPGCYDGGEWAASVPRHPCGEATEHVGG
jgi:hypothetical protein